MAWLSRRGAAGLGVAGLGEAVEAGHGTECQGRARRGAAGLSGLGVARLGVAWLGEAVRAWRGLARRGLPVAFGVE